jgi:diamine N-acetyltransferase
MEGINLKDITDDNLGDVIKIYDTLSSDQKKSVAPNYYSMSQAYVNRDIAWPKAIYFNEELVGFVMLGLDNYRALKIK